MGFPLAFCPEHGFFEAPFVNIGFASTVTFNSILVDCPICRRVVEVLPGEYTSTPDGLNVLLDPSISKEALNALKRLAERVAEGEVSPEEADAEAARISPRLKGFFSRIDWPNQIVGAAVAAAITLAAARLPTEPSTPQTVINNPVTINYTLEKSALLNSTCPAPLLTPPDAPRLKPKKQ